MMTIHGKGQAPFGFRWQGSTLIGSSCEAEVRRQIFELFERSRTKGAVAKLLNERGFRTRRGGQWTDVAVARQLACTSAIGIYAVNRTATDEFGKRVEHPREEWNFVQCEQIVPTELWDRVQAILDEQKLNPPPSGKAATSTFAGFLRCSCGGPMSISSGSAKYSCRDCGNRIPADDLEEIFRNQFAHLVSTRPDLFGDPPSSNESLAEAEDALSEKQEQLASTKREMSKFERLYSAGEFSLDRFAEVHGPLETQRESLSIEISRLRSLIKRRKAQSDNPEDSLDFQILVEEWPSLSLEDKRTIVSSLLERIIIGDGEIEFCYTFPENLEEVSEDGSVSRQMVGPTKGLPRDPNEAVYVRLPKPGQRCEQTGLSRSKLNELILPSARNSFDPPVKSLSLKLPGRARGTRLIVWSSLKQFLADQETEV
jgi:site-specific DNA recombinase